MCKKIDHINTNKVAVVVTLSIFNWLVLNLTTWYYTRNNCTISSKLTANLLNFTFSNVVRQQRHLPIKLCYFNAPGFYFIRYVDSILFYKSTFQLRLLFSDGCFDVKRLDLKSFPAKLILLSVADCCQTTEELKCFILMSWWDLFGEKKTPPCRDSNLDSKHGWSHRGIILYPFNLTHWATIA